MTSKRKLGRPAAGERRDPMVKVTFKVDETTLRALEALEEDFAAIRGRRSLLLRKLILAAHRSK